MFSVTQFQGLHVFICIIQLNGESNWDKIDQWQIYLLKIKIVNIVIHQGPARKKPPKEEQHLATSG